MTVGRNYVFENGQEKEDLNNFIEQVRINLLSKMYLSSSVPQVAGARKPNCHECGYYGLVFWRS